MSAPRNALGRGLGALLPSRAPAAVPAVSVGEAAAAALAMLIMPQKEILQSPGVQGLDLEDLFRETNGVIIPPELSVRESYAKKKICFFITEGCLPHFLSNAANYVRELIIAFKER